MAKAIAARSQGDDYQARWFWIQICHLFTPSTKVVKVAYEANGVKSFDDVVVYYENMVDKTGSPLLAEYYQVKFHVTSAGAFTWEGMMNPAFINARSVSILQRLKNAQQQFAPNGTEAHFILYSPWQIHPDDPLAEVHSLVDGKLDWHRLAQGGDMSKMGKIRTAWRNHLEIKDDEELEKLLCPLRIRQGKTLEELNQDLNDKLSQTGCLKPVEEGQLSHPYDDLIRKLIQTGKIEFTRSDIEDICKREHLWIEQSILSVTKDYLVERREKLDEEFKLSQGRCISRWQALGISYSDAVTLFENSRIGKSVDIDFSCKRLTLLVGEMGTGKSLAAERILQSSIQIAKKDSSAPYPIYLPVDYIQDSKSLQKAIVDSTQGICDAKKQKIVVIIDSPDEAGISFANKLLNEARILTNIWDNLQIIITSRPIPKYLTAEEVKQIPLLSPKESIDLICQVAEHSIPSLLKRLHESVQDAVRRPLFAILLGVYLKENKARFPNSKEELLEYLVRQSLHPLRDTLGNANELLQNLAIQLINNGGSAVSINHIAPYAEQNKLLETRLVVEQEGKLKFPLPVLTQWFAAHSLGSGQVDLNDLVANPETLELWQYPLVIAVSIFSPDLVLSILKPVIEYHPVLGAEIIREALASKSDFINARTPSAANVGQQVLVAMETWIKGLGSLGKLIAPADETGALLDLGVRVYQQTLFNEPISETNKVMAWADIAWGSQATGNSLNILRNNVGASELHDAGWREIQPFKLTDNGSWNWDWASKQLTKSLQGILQRRGLPVVDPQLEYHPSWKVLPPLPPRFPPQNAEILIESIGYQHPQTNGMLVSEGAWHAAIFLTQRYSQCIVLTPIPLQEIENLINQVDTYSSLLSRGVDPLRLNQLILEVKCLRDVNEKYLFYPWMKRFSDDPQDLLIHATTIYKTAIDEYQKIIHLWFSKFIPWLETANRFPACIKGVLPTDQAEKYGYGLSWYWDILPVGSQNAVDLKLSNSPLDRTDSDIQETLRKTKLLRPELYARRSKTMMISRSGDYTMFNWTPVTDLVYQWLWQDLKTINWVEGQLDGYGLFASSPY